MWRGAWATALVLAAALAPLTSVPGPGAGAPSASDSAPSSAAAAAAAAAGAVAAGAGPAAAWGCSLPGEAAAGAAGWRASSPPRPPPPPKDPWRARPCAAPFCACTAGAARCERLGAGAAARALATLRAAGGPPAAAEQPRSNQPPPSRLRRPRLLSLRGSALRDLRPGAFDAYYFAKVRELVLARTGLRRLRAGTLRGLRGLRALDLSGNALRAVPASALASTPALASLDLSRNAVAALADGAFTGGARQLRRLRTLRLDGNALRAVGPRALRGLPRLRELGLAGNRLVRLPPLLLRPARALVLLDLGDNAFASAAALPQAQHVLQLRLRDGRLAALPARAFASTSEPARTLSLSLSGHALARLHADTFHGLAALRVLDLSRNRLSALPATLFRPCPALTHLFLARNRLARVDAFPHLGALAFLDLSRNRVAELSDATLPGRGPAALVALHLEQNGLRRVTATALARLPALRVLFLSQNALRSLPPAALDPCPLLGTLDLAANRFTDARAARRLARVPHLVLAFNRLGTLAGPAPPPRRRRPAPAATRPVTHAAAGGGHASALQPPDGPHPLNPPDTPDAAERLDVDAYAPVAPSESPKVPQAEKEAGVFKTVRSFDAADDSKSSDIFEISNSLRSSKTSYSSKTTESFKSVDLSKSPSISETTDVFDDLNDFDMNDGHKTSSFTIGSDISKLPYPDSDDSTSSKVPYALDNFHASKTTKALQSLDFPDVFDASDSFDTPATHGTLDPVSSVTPFTAEPLASTLVQDSLAAPDVSDIVDVKDSREITDSSNDPSSDNTINSSDILDVPVTFDGRTSSYTTKTVNIFQTIKMCNATDISGAIVTLNASDGLFSSDVSTTGVVNLTSKALRALNRSDVVNASIFLNETDFTSQDTELFFARNVSSECVNVAENQSDAFRRGNTVTPPTLLVNPPQPLSPGPVPPDVPTLLPARLTVADVIGLPLAKARNSTGAGACAGEAALAPGSVGVVLQADYSSNGITRVAHDAFLGFCALRRLSLADNLLRRLPADMLRQMPRLQDLDVSGNNVTRLDFLQAGDDGPPPVLTVLDVSRNALRALPRNTFARTPALQILDLSANRLSALRAPVLAPLRHLERLSLAHNQLRDLPPDVLNHSAVLETADLSHNLLANLSFLRSPSLQLLDLSFNRVHTLDGGVFVRVPALKHLDLGDNEISFIDPMAFAGLRGLQYLNLAMNSISQLPDLFIKPMKSLKVLSIARNKLSTLTDFTFAVTSASELMELDMSGNRLSAIHPHAFQYLSELRMLNLSFNQIKQLDKNTFCGNIELTEFDLSENILETSFRLEFATPMLARTALIKILNSYFGGSHVATKE